MKTLIGLCCTIFMLAQVSGQTTAAPGQTKIEHKYSAHTVCFSPQGERVASGSYDSDIIIWDVASGQAMKKIQTAKTYANKICFSPDGKSILAAQRDGTAALWDIESGNLIRQFVGHDPTISVYDVTISPDGKYVATGSQDKTAKLFDFNSGQLICTYTGHNSTVFSVSISTNGQYLATGSADNTLRVWDLPSGNLLKVLATFANAVMVARYNPQVGSILVATLGLPGCELKLLGMDSGSLIRSYSNHGCELRKAYFSADGKYFVVCGSWAAFSLYDTQNGEPLRQFAGHASSEPSTFFSVSATSDISISPDNRFIVSCGNDKTIRLWDLASGEQIRIFGQ